jgi:hypothetical protein
MGFKKEFFCVQTISVRFPSTLGGKTPSFDLFPMVMPSGEYYD